MDPEDSPIEIAIDCSAWQTAIPQIESVVRSAVAVACAQQGGAKGSVVVLLADDTMVRDLNRRFRGKDKATNVLSFPAVRLPAGGPEQPLGDLALAFETMKAEAESAGITLSHHLSHLLVHGTLHLLGHTHENDADEARMMAMERAALAKLGVPDPYAKEDAA